MLQKDNQKWPVAVSEYTPSEGEDMFTHIALVGTNRREMQKKERNRERMGCRYQNVPTIAHGSGKSGGDRALAWGARCEQQEHQSLQESISTNNRHIHHTQGLWLSKKVGVPESSHSFLICVSWSVFSHRNHATTW